MKARLFTLVAARVCGCSSQARALHRPTRQAALRATLNSRHTAASHRAAHTQQWRRRTVRRYSRYSHPFVLVSPLSWPLSHSGHVQRDPRIRDVRLPFARVWRGTLIQVFERAQDVQGRRGDATAGRLSAQRDTDPQRGRLQHEGPRARGAKGRAQEGAGRVREIPKRVSPQLSLPPSLVS